MVIDAHQHFWQYDPQRHGWIGAEMQAIRRSFMPTDLEPLLEANAVAGTILVQVDQSAAENDFCLRLATHYPWIRGVVGWIDLQATDIREQAAQLKQEGKLKGFRHIAQSEPDPRFLMRPAVINGVQAIGALGFTYDILVYPQQLKAAMQLVARCPYQPFVLDHLAKPYIRRGDIEGWQKDMELLSQYPNVWAKLSGLVTEADWQQWQPQDVEPYLDVALETFGPARLMWGSDWPVCLLAATYEKTVLLVRQYITELTPAEQEAIMGRNALAFYNCWAPHPG